MAKKHPLTSTARGALATLVGETDRSEFRDLVSAVSGIVTSTLDALEERMEILEHAAAEMRVTVTRMGQTVSDQGLRIRALEELAAGLLAKMP